MREDLFAGFLANDMERLERGEQALQVLLSERPNGKFNVLAWLGSAELYRAVRAHEQDQRQEFDRHYKRALILFDEAARLTPPNRDDVAAITGAAYVLMGDRLPEEHRPAAWAKSYENYQKLWKSQSDRIERMGLHFKGELLAGLAQSAQRTGRMKESSQFVDRMMTLLAGSPYEARAKRWKENPELASRTMLACLTCHDAGRLEARRAELGLR